MTALFDRKSFALLVADFWRGAALKFLSIGSSGWFLVWVVPALVSGVLAEYVFLSSIGLLVGRLVSMGLDEQLPLEIRGQPNVARKWSRLLIVSYAASLVSTLFIVAIPSTFFVVILLSSVYVSQNVLAGIIRSVSASAYESLVSLHAVVFAFVTLVPLTFSAHDLVLLYALSLLVSHLIVVVAISSLLNQGATLTVSLADVKATGRRGLTKMINNFSLTLSMRGIVIWPSIIGKSSISDTLAFVVLLGEAAWQMGMVLVNRSYARFCQAGAKIENIRREFRSRSIVLVAGFLALGGLVFIASPFLLQLYAIDWVVVGILIVMYGPVCALVLCRYALWSTNSTSLLSIGGFLSWFFLQGVFFTWLDPSRVPIFVVTSIFVIAVVISQRTSGVVENAS